MGSFAITYDDFTGGHYMGDKSAATPSNTWYGTNALLNSQGELIPGSTALFGTFANPSGLINGTIHNAWLEKRYGTTYCVVTYDDGASPANYSTYVVSCGTDGNVTSGTNSYLLTGVVGGSLGRRQFGAWNPQDLKYYYVDSLSGPNPGYIRSFDFTTDALVSSALSGLAIENLTIYKFRMLAWKEGSNKFYYSDNTMSTWSTGDYYELSGGIFALIPRANDLVAITREGVYSITGVLGSSVNIQQIGPFNELVVGLENAVASGRSLMFVAQNDRTSPVLSEWLGTSASQVARFSQSDINEYTSNDNTYHLDLNILNNGQTVVAFDNGVMYLKSPSGAWARLYNEIVQQAFAGKIKIATEYTNLFELSGSTPQHETYAVIVMNDNDADTTRFYKYKIGGFLPSGTYEAYVSGTYTSPFSATVKLSEYWHQKPMTVREIMVEAVYDREDLLELVGDATISMQILPVGAVDYEVNDTSALTSATQTYTTTISSVTNDNSRVLHRFRTDDAVKAYGFSPQITWQGCRIRRVIAICED